MATKEEIKNALIKWINMMDDPQVAEEFEGYNKTLQFTFPDIEYKTKMIFKDKSARLEDGFDEKAEMGLETNSDLFLGIATGEIDPMEAFMEGEIIIRGDMNAIQRLEIFMDL
ncbi:MAG: SCP2 sterol-binding domain-containing protein [Candidatus Heimdallarchaeota archaeon]